jgi:two-component system sensor histidine kinase KdpD
VNEAGSRHVKRYQDVEELLVAGIDVYTTLNVQHLESMNDVVAQISGVRVKETIPDSVFDDAEEIKIVDLPPQELMQRFREGKVYVPEQAAVAIENFFNEGNLIALREMTFRRAAEHVDEQMLEYMQSRSIPGPWPAGERLLVCIGNSQALNERLVRTGRRLADELQAEWFALYVETLAHSRLSRRARQQALSGIELASSLGAKTASSFGVSIAEEVVRYARKNNVTRIIVGRPLRAHWRELIFGSVADQIVRLSRSIDLLIISELEPRSVEGGEKEELPKRVFRRSDYWYCIWLVMLVSILGILIKTLISPTNVVMVYLIGVVVAAISWGLWPAIFTSAFSVLAFDFLFVPPSLSFRVTDSEYFITFGAFLFVGIVISLLVARARENASAAQRREDYTSSLYSLSVDLASAKGINEVLETVSSHVARSCHCKSAYLLPENGLLKLVHASRDLKFDEKEMTAANWTFKTGFFAGKDTETLSSASLRYYPLRTPNGVVGVMGVQPEEQEGFIKLEQERLIQAFAIEVALDLERMQLWDRLCRNGKLL